VLTEEQVISIRKERKEGSSCVELGRKYGFTRGYISKICNYEIWKYVGVLK
jgi:hypothetical protein